MTDHESRVYPASKPILNPTAGGGTGAAGTTNSSTPFPPTKSQLYGATRPLYRPPQQPPPKHYSKRSRRGCACCCCLWLTLLIISLLLLTAITGAVFYVIYRPQRPSFTVTSLRIPQLNITTSKDSTTHLTSKLDLIITAKNPNKKVEFMYNPITVSVRTTSGGNNDIHVGDGSFPSFLHGTKNLTLLKATISGNTESLESDTVKTLRADLKKKSGLALEVQMDTKVKVKMGGLKTNKVRIRVVCSGIRGVVGVQKKVVDSSDGVKCKVNLRVKIWKWTF